VKRLALFHHDPERTDPEVDRLVELCGKELTMHGSDISCWGAMEGFELVL
jgi:hypothetical protein